MIGVKPLFSGRSLGEGENANFDVVAGRARRQDARGATGCATSCCKIESRYQYYRRDGRWEYEPVKTTRRIADGTHRRRARQAGPHLAAGAVGPLSARSLERRRATGR